MKLTILGSTGSIGTQALDVVGSGEHKVVALSAGRNITLLEQQVRQFSARYAVCQTREDSVALAEKLADTDVQVLWGQDGVAHVAGLSENDLVLNAIVGIAGLRGTMAAVNAGTTLALANKESLVCAGSLVMPLARRLGVEILPVDSEHSAIFQSLLAGNRSELKSILLTASGGPFFGKSLGEMATLQAKDALKHPSWAMGAKITIDSATLMNKGFELIEAMWLFDLQPEEITVVVHRESIVHSAVEFVDGNVIAQMSMPDMRLPIQYALTYPQRKPLVHKPLKLWEIGKLTFFQPDTQAFPCLPLCCRVAKMGGNSGAIINGANEVAVAYFLQDKIPFGEIYECVNDTLNRVNYIENPTLEDIFETDRQSREAAINYLAR